MNTVQSKAKALSRLRLSRELGFVLALFLTLRLVSLAWGLLVTTLLPVNRDAYPYVGVEPLPPGHILEPWQRWDTPIYQALAEQGYGALHNLLFTPPFYPALIAIVAQLLGGQTMLAAMLIANAFYLIALINFYRLAQLELGDEGDARRAVLYLALFPMAFFLLSAYNDSIFLAGATGALYNARRGRWWAAAGWGALGAAARVVGIVLLLPLAWEGWQQWRGRALPRGVPWPTLACLVAVLAGAAALPLYGFLALDQSPLAPIESVTGTFHRTFAIPGQSIIDTLIRVFTNPQGVFLAEWFDLTFVLLFLALLVLVWRRLPPVYGIYCVATLLVYLTYYDAVHPLKSQGRYVQALFPAFLILAQLGQRPGINRLILYPFAGLLLLLSGQFFIGGWVG